MTYVDSITELKSNKRKVHLNNGVDFVLYAKECKTYHIAIDTEVDDELWEELLTEVFLPRAKRRAMHLLEKQEYSEKQLRDKLRDNGYPQEAIDAAIAYVSSYHYIDDERIARAHIRFYQDCRSRKRLEMDLRKKGISDDIISLALEEELEQSQVDLIQTLLEKKHYDAETATYEEKGKMIRFLMGRGFSYEDINNALTSLVIKDKI